MTSPAPPVPSPHNGVAALRAVFRRQLRRGWPIPLVALLAAIVERLWRAPEPVMWTALLIVPVSMVGPIALNAGTGQRFVLVRPAPWWAWWGGQVASALLLLALAVGLLGVPAFLTGASLEGASPAWLAETLSLITFFGIGITFMSAVRAGAVGSALVVVVVAAVFVLSPMLLAGKGSPGDASSRVHLLLAGLGVVTCVVASAAAVAAGRGDPRRAMAAVAVVWCLFAVPVAAWSSWRWIHPLPPPALADVVRVEVAAATVDGRWVHAGGVLDAGGRRRSDFLLHADTGRWHRLPAVWNRLVAFDAGGRRLGWIEYGGNAGPHPVLTIAVLDDAGGLTVQRRHVLEFRQPTLDLLLVRGSRVALIAPDWVQLRDVDSAAVLASSVRSGPLRLATLTADDALVFVRDAATGSFDARDAEVVRLREGHGEEVLLTVRDLARGDTLTLRPDGQQLLVCRTDRRALPIDRPSVRATTYDLGRKTAVASADIPRGLLSTGFLEDGRAILASRVSERKTVIMAYGADRVSVQTVLDEGSGGVLLGGELRPGLIAVGVGAAQGELPATIFLDVDSGDVTSRLRGVLPLLRARFPQDEDAWRASAPRQVFFTGPQGILAIEVGRDGPRVVIDSHRAADWLAPAR